MTDNARLTQPDATIIIPQHRHFELTRGCICSLRNHDPICWPVIVVDDGSPLDEPHRQTLSDLPQTRQIEQPRQGVSAAWNRGAKEAVTPYLVFLNNDTLSLGAWVDRLLQPLREQRCLLTGVQSRRERALPEPVQANLPSRIFLQGWCFAVSAEAWRSVAGFDESMRLYWSDTDFQSRIWSELGNSGQRFWECLPDLSLRHLGHRTAHDQNCVPHRRNTWLSDRARFIEKWNNPSTPPTTSPTSLRNSVS